jgi:hypothetical protein
MDSDRELKQNFLRTEILDKGYDPEEFLNFLITKKGDEASDLDVWNFQELKSVYNFI